MKKISILLFICLTTFLSCKKEDSKEVLIRVRNQSAYPFKNVVVNSYNEAKRYGVIQQGQNSVYMKFDVAYRYAYIKLTAGNKEFSWQPYDYVGETPLEPGKYTYSLSISDFNAGRLELSFRED
ncbi:MAG TPA: hypothetical protein VLZ28_06750 [Daejeonella sp.]|nr:hypothetical protein [Daejeonella sp.]